jgi:prepilin-type processing-associated H-X9-DG protein/prepilin-type N-terminal cleavage/methylation domain-containing protein
MRPTGRRTHVAGFTLVELLVVIGIVAVLIAILMPTLARAREQAQRLRCVSNLHSLGHALVLYTGQCGYYPLGENYPGSGDHAVWPLRLWELLGRNRVVFFCPARPDTYRWLKSGEDGRFWNGPDGEPEFKTFGGSVPFSYAYNLGGVDTYHFDRGIGGTRQPTLDYQYREVRANRVKVPAQMFAIADGPDTHGPPFVPDCFALVPVSGGISLRLYAPSGPHRGRLINMLFCDGHVETLLRNEVVPAGSTLYSTAVRQRWNRDNLP